MSVFYDEASLVVVPSGYKSGKIYAQKPLTTDGQLTFTRASTATRVNASGLIEAVASGVPRLDYLGSSCPKLYLEPQRTNLMATSRALDGLTLSNMTVTANDAVSPDGATNAEKLIPSGSGFHTAGTSLTVTSGTPYTISVFYKNGNHKNIGFYDNNTSGSEIQINVEANTYTLGANVTAGGIIPYGNGWYRAWATFSPSTTTMNNLLIFRDNTNNGNYTATGSYIWAYGWQVEAGSYPTSLIWTSGAAVTRLADSASKTGISSLIGQTEGTLFVDFVYKPILASGQDTYRVSLSDGTYTNRCSLIVDAATIGFTNTMYITCGSVSTNTFPVVDGERYVLAFAYKNNNFAFYVNGVQVQIISSGTVPASLTQLQFSDAANIATRTFAGPINQALLFKTRLSNAKLAELTTL